MAFKGYLIKLKMSIFLENFLFFSLSLSYTCMFF